MVPGIASTWSPLRNPTFRSIWLVEIIVNHGVFMQSVGAAWLMTSLTSSPQIVALVQTAANIPFFLFSIPAGVLADMVERRRVIRFANGAMFVVVATLAALTAAHRITQWSLLAFTFALYTAASMQEPAWASLIPEIVDEVEVPEAIALNSINFNLSRIFGPTLAGLVVAAFGPAAAFLANALSFLGPIAVLRPQRPFVVPPLRAFRAGFAETVDLVRTAGTLRTLIVRNAAFGFVASALWSLLPVLARRHLHADAPHYGAMIAALGVGAILVGFVMSRIRARIGVAPTLAAAMAILGIAMLTLGATDRYPIAVLALFVGGFGWLISVSSYNTAIQFAVAPTHRARGFGIYLVGSQGVVALAAVFWGWVATVYGTPAAYMAAGTLTILTGIANARFELPWAPARA